MRFAQALMQLFEYRDDRLAANGEPISVILDGVFPSERAVADALANHVNRRHCTTEWTHLHFYRATRGLDLDADEVAAFVTKCRANGVELTSVPDASGGP